MNTLTNFTLAATVAFISAASFADTMKDDKAHSGMSGEMHKSMQGDMPENMKGMHDKMGDMKGKKQDSGPMSEGVIRKVDTEARTLTIKHGPIKNLGMPPMTMVFQTDENIAVDDLQTDQAVKFRVVNKNGKMTITEVEPAS